MASPAPRISLAVRVPKDKGEATRQRLRDLGVLRLDLKPSTEGPWLLLPVQDRARDAFLGLDLTTSEFEAQEAPPPRYQELAQVPDEVRALLPTSFDVVGHAIVLKLPGELRPHAAEVGRALLAAHRQARTVLADHGVQGVARVRQVEVIAGEPDTVVEHVEHGLRYRVDLATCYFSPRLATERLRTAEQVQAGEVVLDMFAGVGPFAILVAKQGKASRVYAVDINPDAVRFLEENARRNKVQDKVRPVLADGAAFAPSLAGQCDRVIMNLPHTASQHWEAALQACKPQAVVHLHAIAERDALPALAASLQTRARAAGWEAKVRAQREVRLYSPSQAHFALDVEVRRKPTG